MLCIWIEYTPISSLGKRCHNASGEPSQAVAWQERRSIPSLVLRRHGRIRQLARAA
jgi:hypothetical protein